MNAVQLIKILSKFQELNIPKPLSIEVDARSFRELKSDLYAIFVGPLSTGLKENEAMVAGVKIIGKLCECGAHPEDWE